MSRVVSRHVEFFIDLFPKKARKLAPAEGFVKQVKTEVLSKRWRSKKRWGEQERKEAMAEAKRLREIMPFETSVVLGWFTTVVHQDGMHVFDDSK